MRGDIRTYLTDDAGARKFGPGPFRLLARVDELGSLRSAAQSMGMAYTKATRLVRSAEEALGFTLTERTVGGSGGGGSRLTPEGRDLLERYLAFEGACRRDMEREFRICFSGYAGMPRVGCVVMASGAARRFGSNKLLAELAGAPVLRRTLSALPPDVLDVVVVTRSEGIRELCRDLGVRAHLHQGALQSDTVREGLRALGECPAYLFVPGDQPLLSAASVRRVVAEGQRHPGEVVRLAWKGRPGSPVLFPAGEAAALAAIEGDEGGSAILRHGDGHAPAVRLVEAASELELADIDTPEDLARLESALTEEADRS